MDKDSLKKIISHSKEYGFIFPSSEIYEGLNAIYDYAHNGALPVSYTHLTLPTKA